MDQDWTQNLLNKIIDKDKGDRILVVKSNKTSGVKRDGEGNQNGENNRRKKKFKYELGDENWGQGEEIKGVNINSFLFSGLEGVKRSFTPKSSVANKLVENTPLNNRKITDWIRGCSREKCVLVERSVSLALEWAGNKTLAIEWDGGGAESTNDNPGVEVKSSKCDVVRSKGRQLFGMFEPTCGNVEENVFTKNEKKSGTETIKQVKRKVWAKLPSGLFGYRTVRVASCGWKGNANKSEPKPKQSGAPSAQAVKRKIANIDSGGDRPRPGENESERWRLEAKRSRWKKGPD